MEFRRLLDGLANGLEKRADPDPLHGEFHAGILQLMKSIDEARRRQQEHQKAKAAATADLQRAVRAGRELVARLFSYLDGTLGKRSHEFHHYGVDPQRKPGRPRKGARRGENR
ncbi:MAG: hypothetical protein HYY17_14630 [Planctomycetes bacterium]|nr:hypothetical protein [Planctomycetota bacterium]